MNGKLRKYDKVVNNLRAEATDDFFNERARIFFCPVKKDCKQISVQIDGLFLH